MTLLPSALATVDIPLDGLYPQTESAAVISLDGRYRYSLTRTWAKPVNRESRVMVFVMLNPSTADAAHDDPTIRRCRGFALREGMDGLFVVNLYALRATNPQELLSAEDPVGPDNDTHVAHVFSMAADRGWSIVAAWGAGKYPEAVAGRVDTVCALSAAAVSCLGISKGGAPRHPLYLPRTAPLAPWPSPLSLAATG